MITINFYRPTAWRGVARLLWWVVSLFSRRYIHCDFTAPHEKGDPQILTSNFKDGVTQLSLALAREPAEKYVLDRVPPYVFWGLANKYIGSGYGIAEFLSSAVRGLEFDSDGLICSELVAKLLIECCDWCEVYPAMAEQLKALPPHDATPRAVWKVVRRHLRRVP